MPAAPDLEAEVAAHLAAHPPARPPAALEERFAWLVEQQRRLHEAGLAVVSWPEEHGGRGLPASDALRVSTALGRAGAPELINFVAIEVIAPALAAFADADQLTRWLPPMAGAEEVWCQLFSEPDAGSDLAALRTRATFDGEVWRIHGAKVWSTWAQFASKGLLLARTGPLADRHRSIAAFVIEMDQPGVDVHPLATMTGAAEFAEVTFDGAVVHPDDVVGDVAAGWGVTLRTLESERGPYAIRRAAVLSGALQRVLDTARRRALDPHRRRRVVDAYTAMWALERRAGAVAARLEAGEDLGAEATLTKVALTQAEQEVFAVAHELLGLDGQAWVEEPEVVEEYLYSRAASIYGGSAQVQRNILAERFLGLPRDPRP